MHKTLSKEELRNLVNDKIAKGAQITRVKSGAKSLDLTEREWNARVRMTKEEAMARDAATDDDGYAAYEKQHQDAWEQRHGAR
jgi:hypothetical protein